MQFKRSLHLPAILLLAVFVLYSNAQTIISSNKTGKQGDYYYEYWKDNGSGTMTLGEGCDFICTWGSVGNILFRKGVRPGSRKEIVTYSADYKPTGNSYLSIYGWFQNPLVEYYIIESWGSWKPPGSASKGTIETDSGTYDIYQNTRTGPSIEGNKTFQQYWSVRKTKRTSGAITCANHFDAWEKKGMTIGKLYEVSFNVEAYQSSGGSADVKVSMDTVPPVGIAGSPDFGASQKNFAPPRTIIGMGHFNVTTGGSPTISFILPGESYAALKVCNILGQQVALLAAREYCAGQNSVTFNTPKIPSGLYFYSMRITSLYSKE